MLSAALLHWRVACAHSCVMQLVLACHVCGASGVAATSRLDV